MPERGSVTTLFDERDLPVELQFLDSEGRVVTQFIRTYDANGRIIGENQIQENPALLIGDRFSGEAQEKLDNKQFEAMNKALKAMMSAKNGTGTSFVYDSQGRLTEVRDRNWASDSVRTTSYNEHGDTSEERQTVTNNLAYPQAYTIDEDGSLIPDRSDGVSDPPPVPERTMLNIIEYRYEYDQYGNWTERTEVYRQESYEQSTVHGRGGLYVASDLVQIFVLPGSSLQKGLHISAARPLESSSGNGASGIAQLQPCALGGKPAAFWSPVLFREAQEARSHAEG